MPGVVAQIEPSPNRFSSAPSRGMLASEADKLPMWPI